MTYELAAVQNAANYIYLNHYNIKIDIYNNCKKTKYIVYEYIYELVYNGTFDIIYIVYL